MSAIKTIIKKYIPIIYKWHALKSSYRKACRNKKYKDYKDFFIGEAKKYHIIQGTSEGIIIKKALQKAKIHIVNEDYFFQSIDPYIVCFANENLLGNLSIDYEQVLNGYWLSKKYLSSIKQKEWLVAAKAILAYRERAVACVKVTSVTNKSNIERALNGIGNNKANSLFEALQRMLFVNQILWQTGHRLIGFGRIDFMLNEYLEEDYSEGRNNDQTLNDLLNEFVKAVHQYYWFKSNMLLGDTGQLFILGGLMKNGNYFCNSLTYGLINAVRKLGTPDPKVLLRVSANMPYDLMEAAVKCVASGIGCPLFSNDDVVVPTLLKNGVNLNDAYNYATSACWEPLIVGKSLDQNNCKRFNFILPLEILLKEEKLNEIDTYDKLLKLYIRYLKESVKEFICQLDVIEFKKDPLLSLLVSDCINKNVDVANGGAIYSNYGVTTLAMSNTVNALLNICQMVFIEKKYTLEELVKICHLNYVGYENVRDELKRKGLKYGMDEKMIINMVNDFIDVVYEESKRYRNKFGGRVKFGLSSPDYIAASEKVQASLDGRNNFEPFAVHISAPSGTSYTELVSFASQIKYQNGFTNGNVVDFFVAPSFIDSNFDKFVAFMLFSIKQGYYQMQINVVSSSMLIAAQNDPDKYPNLIVRVWGFSAYFKDLPVEYQNVLINRALESEKAT